MRTTDEVIIDFNPSNPVHWIYDEVMPREKMQTVGSARIKTTSFLAKI